VKPDEPNLTERDKLLRDSFTAAESQLSLQLLLTAFIAFWLADPRSFWALGFFLISGGFCLFVLKTHEESHPFFIDLLWPKFWLYSAPIWCLILQSLVGLAQSPIQTIEIGERSFLALNSVNPWLPTTTVSGTNWMSVLGFCSLYLTALNLFLVPKSRAFFEKVLPWLCLFAVLVSIVGYLQEGFNLTAPLFTKGTGQLDFFSYFPYDGHWAAFALIWSGVCTSLGLLSTRYDDSPDFINSISPWYLTGAALLGLSGLLVEARWPSVILLISYSAMLLLVCSNYAADKKDRHHTSIALTSGLLASIVFACALFRIFRDDPSRETTNALQRAAFEMFKDSPLFGWGMDSFRQLAPYYVDDTLGGLRFDRASSDVLQLLAEIGMIGTIVPIIILTGLVIHYLKGKIDVRTTNHMLIGCVGVIAMTFVDTPLMSPAVFFSLFVVIFSAVRWADLSRNRVDEVDAIERPTLVTPEAERRVPFYTGEYKDQEK